MSAFQSGEWADVPSIQMGQPEPALSTKLNFVIPFIESEIPLVISLLQRSLERSGQIPRTLYLLPFKGLEFKAVRVIAEKAFGEVQMLQDCEGKTSDWQDGRPMRSASGPNSMFRQAAWFAYLKGKSFGPWMWLEPDCMPQKGSWWRDLEAEYLEYTQPFMGVRMQFANGKDYMNGVGVYPWNAIQYAPLLVQSAMWKQHPDIEVGFDVAGGKDVLDKAHITKKIQLVNHLTKEKSVVIRDETVLVHGRLLSGHGERREAVTEVLPESASELYSHETPAQSAARNGDVSLVHTPSPLTEQPPASSQPKEDGYGSISKDIRIHVNELVRLWNDHPHRKVLIVKELRKSKLVPKHFR